MRLLFVCSRNRLRSPTAERIFADIPGIETCSAGLSPDAEEPLSADLVAWADVILVMERRHHKKLTRTFGRWLRGKRVVCLDIADDYAYMDAELVRLLWERVLRAVPEVGDGK
jgi:predicted protein tyrosine phosphatase